MALENASYAAEGSVRGSRAESNVRGWATGRRCAASAAAILVALVAFVPYPTTLSPSISLQVLDEQARPLPNLSVTWRGGFYAAYFEERHVLDGQGRLILPSRRVWSSLVSRLFNALECLLPHSGGFRDHFAEVYFTLPNGRSFDGNGGVLPLVWDSGPSSARMRTWSLNGPWLATLGDGMTDLPDYLSISTSRPGAGGPASCQIVLPPTAKGGAS